MNKENNIKLDFYMTNNISEEIFNNEISKFLDKCFKELCVHKEIENNICVYCKKEIDELLIKL